MQTISRGDLFFVDSPFHIEPPDPKSTEQEKRLSYILGTVSSRPAVVIRPPEHWDRFGTVTVIPASRTADPGITMDFRDRYGRLTDTKYTFAPHSPHTIPVERLGKYIGHMTQDELDRIILAFIDVHTRSQAGTTNRYISEKLLGSVPKIYDDARKDESSSSTNETLRRAPIEIVRKDGYEVVSKTYSDLNGFPIGAALVRNHTTEADKAVVDEPDYVVKEDPSLPFANAHDADEQPRTGVEVVVTDRRYPESIYSKEILDEIASRFTISDGYYTGDKKKPDLRVFTKDEMERFRGDLRRDYFDEALELYNRFTPFDAILLAPRLPLTVFHRVSGLPNKRCSAVLKTICNALKRMTDEEYQSRMSAVIATEDAARAAAENPKVEAMDAARRRDAQSKLAADQKRAVNLCKPYLNAKRVLNMPDDVAEAFLSVPPHMLRREWEGPQAKIKISQAIGLYEKKLRHGADSTKEQ